MAGGSSAGAAWACGGPAAAWVPRIKPALRQQHRACPRCWLPSRPPRPQQVSQARACGAGGRQRPDGGTHPAVGSSLGEGGRGGSGGGGGGGRGAGGGRGPAPAPGPGTGHRRPREGEGGLPRAFCFRPPPCPARSLALFRCPSSLVVRCASLVLYLVHIVSFRCVMGPFFNS